jgi:hypothetical protein
MPNFRLVPKISFVNQKLVAPKARVKLRVPVGVTAHDPIRVSFGEMSTKEPRSIPAPAGLTIAAAGVELPGQQRAGSTVPAEYIFDGGDIVLNVEIGIYIIKQYAPIPALFKRIMEHEYLHVADYQNLAKSQMSKLIEADATLRPWLNGQAWRGSAFFDRVEDLWGSAAEKLGNALDSGATYEAHKRAIAKLAPRI